MARQCRQWPAAIVGLAALVSGAKADDRDACFSTALGSFTVATVVDGRSFKLADGREVLLTGILVPPPRDAAARTALTKLLSGGNVTLKQADSKADRYGRLSVQAFAVGDGAERWIQHELLAAGDAQVGPGPGSVPCTKALLAAETKARRSRAGIWANSAYGIKASDDLTGLLAQREQWTIAEGKVLSVRESGGTLYMNFGRVWSRNLTVTVLRRNRAGFDNAGMDPKKLEGARVRVRGFVEERGGPRIEAVSPEQIEIAAQD